MTEPLKDSVPSGPKPSHEWIDFSEDTEMKLSIPSSIDAIEDKDWITHTFAGSMNTVPKIVLSIQASNSADNKYTDASLGGSYSLNAEPQFTPYADPRRSILTSPESGIEYDPSTGLVMGDNTIANYLSPAAYNTRYPSYTGMGGIYSAQHDDVKQTIRMVAGVPKFNSALAFWSNFLNPDVETLARTGTAPSILLKGASLGITAILLTTAAMPYMITAWIIRWVSGLFFGESNGRYYRLEPTPHVYLTMLNTLINQFTARTGLYPDFEREQNDERNKTVDDKIKADSITRKEILTLNNLAPSIFTKDYGIDMFSIMGRTEQMRRISQEILANRSRSGLDGRRDVASIIKGLVTVSPEGFVKPKSSTSLTTLYDALKHTNSKYVTEDYTKQALENQKKAKFSGTTDPTDPPAPEEEEGSDSSPGEANTVNTKEIVDKLARKPDNYNRDTLYDSVLKPKTADADEAIVNVINKSNLNDFTTWLKIFADKGALYNTFDVEYTGAVTETWSTETAEIESGQAFNSTSAGITSTKYNLAGGNILGGAIGDGLESLISGAGTVIMGAANFATGGLASAISGLFRGASIDLPKRVAGSTVELPGASYSFTISCHSGSKYTQLTQAWIPVFALMCLASPRKVGPASHTVPFLVSLHDPGRINSPINVISKLSITRGEGNVGFNADNETLTFKVNFDVVSLAPIMSIPISTGSIFNTTGSTMMTLGDELSEYLDAVSARTIAEKTFLTKRIALSKIIATRQSASMMSNSTQAHAIMDSGAGRLWTSIFGTEQESNN